jgi:hypothetical protein
MPERLVTMSANEIDRLAIVARVVERRLSQKAAARMMGLSTRQVRRMCRAYERDGAAGMISKRRGRSSNNRFSDEVHAHSRNRMDIASGNQPLVTKKLNVSSRGGALQLLTESERKKNQLGLRSPL